MMQEAGVRLTAQEAAQFIADLDNASQALTNFGIQTQHAAQQTTNAFDRIAARQAELVDTTNLTAAEAFSQAVQEMGQSADGSTPPVAKLGDTVQETSAKSAAAAEALQTLSTQMLALGTAGSTVSVGTAVTASRIEELEVILEITRQNAVALARAEGDLARASALTSSAVQAQVQGIRALHISGIDANETVAQLIRYNLDWTRATELAALAQNSATFAAQNSSQALNGLVRGITTLQTRQLRTYGIMINLNAAYADFAAANNIATNTLTETQKQQAAMNAVLAQAPAVQGAYTAAMGTASKQLRSLKTDTIDLAEAYGEHLTPILDSSVGAFRSVLHVLTDLPDPAQAFAVSTLATASSLSLVGGTVIKLLPRLTDLKNAFVALSVSSKALLGLGGIASILVGLAAAATAAEKAHQEEAAALLMGADTYRQYITQLDKAGISAYGLTEALYELVKAQEASNQAAFAAELQNTFAALEALTGRFRDSASAVKSFVDLITNNGDVFSDFQLLILQDRDSVVQLGTQLGLTGEELRTFVAQVLAAAEATATARAATENYNRFEQERYHILKQIQSTQPVDAIEDETAAMTRLTTEMDNYSEAVQQAMKNDEVWYRAATDARVDLKGYQEAVTEAVEDSAWKQLEAMQQLHDDLQKLDLDYATKRNELWAEYADTVAEVERDIAAFHAGTLKELLDLDREMAQKRIDAQRDYAQAIEDSERQLAQDLADLEHDHLQDLADLERDFAQDREDILRDLARDLEDIEQDHLSTMQGLEKDYYEDLAAMAEDYQQKIASIEEKYARERESIEEKYRVTEPPEVPDIDEQREELLSQLRELLGLEDAYTKQGYRVVWEERKAELERQLDELKQTELDELERRKQEELAELEAWLAEEEAKREEAYQIAQQEEERRFQERKAEREREGQQRLDDLERQHQREREEIERDYQEKFQQLQLKHQREREEIEINNRRKLEDMEAQYEHEKELIREGLEEQLATAEEKYSEGLRDLNRWYDDQKVLINQKYKEQIADIEHNLQLIVLKASEEFGKMPEAFRPIWDELVRQGQERAKDLVDGIIAEFQRLFDFFQIGSPSKLMEQFANDVVSPLESVWGNVSASDLLGDALGADAFQANINAALGEAVLPPQRAMVPSGAISTSISRQNSYNLHATFPQGQSYASVRDQFRLMEMASQ